jgi:AhpD family alkylhydroperoxidase
MHEIHLVEPAENEFLASLESKSKKASPFLRAMANRPEVLKSFVPLYSAVMGPGSVDRRIKLIVYLVCSFANECAYCIDANIPGAKKAGLTDEEIQAIQTEQDHIFPQNERAAIWYARDLTQLADAEDSRIALLEHFTSEQAVEITLVAATANSTPIWRPLRIRSWWSCWTEWRILIIWARSFARRTRRERDR